MKKQLFILVSIALLSGSCTEDFEQPFNERVSAGESGLVGIWEGFTLQKEYALALKDSLGNTVVDDRNRTVWYDTLEVIENWNEAIHFTSNAGVDSFAISAHVDSLLSGILLEVGNMPLTHGQWAVVRTINPEGEKPDAESVMFYNPSDPHNSTNSILWTIVSQNADEISLSYSFGSSSYDTLYIKTYRKR